MTRVIIAGSRSISNYDYIERIMDAFNFPNRDVTIVSGGANGVDALGEEWAEKHDKEIILFDPYNSEETMTSHSYNEDGKFAFLQRNTEMADYADVLIAIWDGKSTGTQDMIEKALARDLDIIVQQVK